MGTMPLSWAAQSAGCALPRGPRKRPEHCPQTTGPAEGSVFETGSTQLCHLQQHGDTNAPMSQARWLLSLQPDVLMDNVGWGVSPDRGTSYSLPECPVSCIRRPAPQLVLIRSCDLPVPSTERGRQEALPPTVCERRAQNLPAGWGPISLDPVLGLDLGVFPGLACRAQGGRRVGRDSPEKPPLLHPPGPLAGVGCLVPHSRGCVIIVCFPPSARDPLSPHPPEGEGSAQWALALGGLG